jgi:peptide deformylase
VQVAVVYLRRQNEEPLKLALFNPEILSAEGELSYEEGCLSVPEITETVIRPQKIKLSFQDYAGKEQEMEADEVLARVIQHEIDHLYGTLFFDHLSRVKRALIKNKLKKILTGEVGK